MARTFPPSPRLRLAVEAAARCLMEEDVRAFPIRPEDIIRRRGWQLCTYGQMAARLGAGATAATVTALYGGAQAFASEKRIDGLPVHYLIAYDELVAVPERIRFSLAHEIGHILLGHFDFGPPDALPEEHSRLLDAEANAFAANLLAPAAIVALLRRRREGDRLLFGLSKAGWRTRLDTLCQDEALCPAEAGAYLSQQFAAYLFRRQCTACGAVFLHHSSCPACGSEALRWAPAGEEDAAFPWTAESWRAAPRSLPDGLDNPMTTGDGL